MGTIPVFAGLGSEQIFAGKTARQALRDARSSHGRLLIEACHSIFVEELSLAALKKDEHGSLGIDLDDFRQPRDLVEPCERYHSHPVVQHVVLALVQLLRCNSQQSRSVDDVVAASGFCAGLLSAVAAVSAQTPLQFLARAEQCFRAAVLLGIAIQRAQRKIRPLSSVHPWCVILGNVDEQEIAELASQYSLSRKMDVPIYISSKNTKTCITVSGEGEALHDFTQTQLPSNCMVKPTNVFAMYHSTHLESCRDWMCEEFENRGLAFPSRKDLLRPVISTLDGSLIEHKDAASGVSLLREILDMIFVSKTDWVAVQERLEEISGSLENGAPLNVCNYGPGDGIPDDNDQKDFKVRDVSEELRDDRAHENDIAIVGVGVDLPDAPDLDSLWENLMNGINSCSEIPLERFDINDYYTKDPPDPSEKRRTMGTKFGNFLQDPFSFDNQLFGISPREAASIDPQQRVLLQTVYRALENAGYVPDSTPSFARETFGCFIGNATLDYIDNLKDDIDVYYSPGTLRAFLSGRISYVNGWSGPSVTVDTACSSSIVALHQASQAILAGECRAAVVGGVNLIISPDMYLGLDRAYFLSPTGQCKPFDETADGYCRGEGCAAFVLKRLEDAVRENDRILGVVKGTAVNQSGHASSITHPHPPTQADLFRKLLDTASIRGDEISVIEAHGTGTAAGDPNELKSIREVFRNAKGGANRHPLHVGSIKANIGHLEAASGGASLAKLLLMLQNEKIPPQLYNRLNPDIEDLTSDGTIISTEACDWKLDSGNRRTALLNNFGAAGSNAALLLQEFHSRGQRPDHSPETAYVFGCSARSKVLLEKMREYLLDHLSTHGHDLAIADVCYTSTARRAMSTYRFSTVASSIQELASSVESAKVVEVEDQRRPVVFLFSGQGSQFLGMGKDLYHSYPAIRKTMDRCHDLLTEWSFPSCLDVILSQDDEDLSSQSDETLQAFQSALFVLEVALAQYLITLGIEPAAVAGHSLGEYAALVIAGALDLDSGLWLVSHRAKLIVEHCQLWATSMLAVNMSATQVRKDLLSQDDFAGLSISCENSPSACVVGGDKDTLAQLKEYISGKLERKCALLNVPVAYHTVALDPVLEELGQAAAQVCIRPHTVPIASNVLGRLVPPEEGAFTPEYFADHCRSKVEFDRGIASILDCKDGFTNARWIEIGPHPALLPMVAPRTTGGAAQAIPALKKKEHATRTLANLFASCYQDDVGEVDWRAIFDSLGNDIRLVDLPPAPMDRQKYYVPLKREKSSDISDALQIPGKPTDFTVLESEVEPVVDALATFETPIERLMDLIKGHMVCGSALCPASVYAEFALSAISHAEGQGRNDQSLKLSDMKFSRPLILSEGGSQIVRINLVSKDSDEVSFEISSFTKDGPSLSTCHCTGVAKWQSVSKAQDKMTGTGRSLARRRVAIEKGEHQTFTCNTMYDKIFSRVVDYSPVYRSVQKIWLDENAEEAFALCSLPPLSGKYAGQPVFLDTMLHVAGFAANFNVDNDSVCIAHHVRSTNLLRKRFEEGMSFEVHCSNVVSPTNPDTILADVHAVDADGVIAVIKGMAFQRTKLDKIVSAFAFVTETLTEGNVESASSLQAANDSEEGKSQAGGRQSRMKEQQPVVNGVASHGAKSPAKAKERSKSKIPDETPGSTNVIDILSETTGVEKKHMSPQTDLSALGVDSMMIFELKNRLKDATYEQPSVAELTAVKTVGEFEELASNGSPTRKSSTPGRRSDTPQQASPRTNGVRTRMNGNGGPNGHIARSEEPQDLTKDLALPPEMIDILRERLGLDEQPERIQKNPRSSLAPLWLIHSGAGMCNFYRRISDLGRTVNAIHDPHIFSNDQDDWNSVQEIAEHYADIVQKDDLDSRNALILGGWSFGGVVAFEVARSLMRNGNVKVKGVILVDPPPPLDHVPMSRATIEAATAKHDSHQSKSKSESAVKFEEALKRLIIRNNSRRGALLGRYEAERKGPMPRLILLRSSEALEAASDPPLGDAWLYDRGDKQQSIGPWEELTALDVESIDIPGNHFSPFEPGKNVQGTSVAIIRACEMLEA